MRSDFEQQLRNHWQALDFSAWNQTRGIYADWLRSRAESLLADCEHLAEFLAIGG